MIWVIAVALTIVFLVFMNNHSFLKGKFKRNNVIVFGYKGTGKDVIFQKVIALRKKEHYFSYPQTYGYNGAKINLGAVNVSPNTYRSFILDDVTQIKYQPNYYKADMYFSDGGVIVPSHMDNLLTKQYPSYPIAYALSRQLWKNSVHINTQALSRIWVKLREQADSYFKALWTVNLGIGLLTRVRYFQEYQSANDNLLPFKGFGGGKQARALKKQFTATNGEIKDFFIFTWKWQIKFDSWYYRRVIFTTESLKAFFGKAFGVRK